MKLLENDTKFIYKDLKYYWQTKCINKNHNKRPHQVSHNHPYISNSKNNVTFAMPLLLM